ncbi:MAG: 4-hydroxyphenylacetate 3-monooxygenase [Chloroflexi bacterium]|nr:4-hydroxyphenylacetate 3-monooxygenase [Chloroflexota bacterium]
MPRTGAAYLQSVRDNRTVYLDGKLIENAADHPAFRNAFRTVAGLYDFQGAPENLELMTFPSPTSGERVSRFWQLPKSYQELVQRREAITAWAELTYGFMGRSPDHVGSCLGGMVMGIDLFRSHGEERAQALNDYFTYVRDNDLFVTYVIANPRADRSKSVSQQEDEYLIAAICDEDSQGVTIKGAKMLGTSAVIADELLVTTGQPLRPGEEQYAFSVAIPLATKGLKILPRKSYEATAVSQFDNPLSWHLDENDAVIYFDEVKVPWDRVFVYRDTNMCRAQFQDTPTHMLQNYQAQIRLMVKMRFLLGLARKITETMGTISIPDVAGKLGYLAANTAMVEGMVKGMEAGGVNYGPYFIPDRRLLYATQLLTQKFYPELVYALRDLAGANMIMMPPSADDFDSPETASFIEKTQRSPVAEPKDKVKLFKLAWDAVGSEFGSRQAQYELFYAGGEYVTRGRAFQNYDWDTVTDMVDQLLASYDLPDSSPAI